MPSLTEIKPLNADSRHSPYHPNGVTPSHANRSATVCRPSLSSSGFVLSYSAAPTHQNRPLTPQLPASQHASPTRRGTAKRTPCGRRAPRSAPRTPAPRTRPSPTPGRPTRRSAARARWPAAPAPRRRRCGRAPRARTRGACPPPSWGRSARCRRPRRPRPRPRRRRRARWPVAAAGGGCEEWEEGEEDRGEEHGRFWVGQLAIFLTESKQWKHASYE